ncbi:uncharacterized protein LOC125240349 [Leguminivora glycinivorella]|uniref:uncharacterized protein LOC125240349 n=1 Tax=Leguminivora glycinivorella TaxID=1035111 RepID=UPI00200DA845|nr:uncharacterized protein LOC125240349 [Leguminivora glycinivorella]
MGWERSKEGYPRIWSEFTCEKTKQRFIIKDLSEEYYDIALGYMTNIFLNESAICKPLRILEDPVSRLQMQQKWMKIMRSNMAIICCTDDDEVPRVAAIHFTVVREKGQEQPSQDPSRLNKYEQFTEVVEQLTVSGDLFTRFDSGAYLFSLGLFVLPEFRGLGIATHILKSRLTICRALGLRGTGNVFSTPGAQAAARSAGYQEVVARVYEGQRLALMAASVQ